MSSLAGGPGTGGVAVLLRRLQARPGTTSDDEVLGRCERGALVMAVSIAEAMGSAVTAIAVGPARREDRVLAVALRAGCRRAVRIGDEGLDDIDYFGLAQILAAAVTWAGASVIVCGDRSEEEGTGAIGPAVAELLGAAHVTAVAEARVDGEVLLIERVADGHRQRLRVTAPVVLAAQPPLVAPRVPRTDDDERTSPPLVRRAPTPAPIAGAPGAVVSIEAMDLDRLGLDPRALAHRRATAGRLRAVRGQQRAALATSPADLIARLRADHLVDGGEDPT